MLSALEMYVVATRNSKGLLHKERLAALRDYIRHTKDEDLAKAINNITEEELLNTLWEAGLNKWLQPVVLRRREELRMRRMQRR